MNESVGQGSKEGRGSSPTRTGGCREEEGKEGRIHDSCQEKETEGKGFKVINYSSLLIAFKLQFSWVKPDDDPAKGS